MINNSKSYNSYLKFVENFSMVGFDALKSDEPLMVELEEFTENNDQFFYFGDLLKMDIFFTSKRSLQMMGVEPAEFTPSVFFAVTHPDDLERMGLARAKLFKIASDLFVAKNGFEIFSTNYKLKNRAGNYANILNQLFIFYSTTPYKSVFLLKIHTNIGWYKKLNHGFHFYLGKDISNFRFPDEKLLMLGNHFSEREFEIVKLIGSGMSSEEVAEKIFLSVHTVNTHRRNILKKSGKATISELIYELKDRGEI